MSEDASLWTDLERRGFGQAHLHVLRTLLASTRNGSWTVHVVAGRVSQVDTRIVSPAHPAEMARLEAWVAEALADREEVAG